MNIPSVLANERAHREEDEQWNPNGYEGKKTVIRFERRFTPSHSLGWYTLVNCKSMLNRDIIQ
jgi:hypothetical protein